LAAAGASIVYQLKLNRSAGLMLYDLARARIFRLQKISPILIFTRSHPRSLLPMARSKEGPVAPPPMLVEKEADRSYLTGLERSLCSILASGVLRYPLASGGTNLMTYLLWP
jgi:hypothetical protein